VKNLGWTLAAFLLSCGTALAGGGHGEAGEKLGNGDLLYLLLFWIAIVQGCVAVGAVATFAGARWVLPVRKHVLSVYPMLFVLAAGFVFLCLQMDIYPWTAHEGKWLNKRFFFARNLLCLLASATLAWALAREANRGGKHRVTFAVLYLFSFVATQTLVAFDWVMSLEYPWYSTLFGGFFFMEALLSGFAVSGIFWYFLSRRTPREEFESMKSQRRDMAALTFGLSVFWAYLMFSQVIVIWYGNLPEETTFFLARLRVSPLREMLYSLLGFLFLIPFVTLISRKMKETPSVVLFASVTILTGLLVERVVYLAPLLHLHGPILVPAFLGCAGLFALLVANRDRLLPGGEAVSEAGH